MTAAVYNITIEKGATFTLSFTYKANGVAVNLSGWRAGLQVREDYDSPSQASLDSTTENGNITLGTDGSVTVTITKENTELVTIDAGVYDLLLVAPTGQGIRLLEGKVKVSRDSTKVV